MKPTLLSEFKIGTAYAIDYRGPDPFTGVGILKEISPENYGIDSLEFFLIDDPDDFGVFAFKDVVDEFDEHETLQFQIEYITNYAEKIGMRSVSNFMNNVISKI